MGELIFGIILLVAAFFVRLAASFIKTDSGRPVGGIVKVASLGLAVVGVLVVLGATAVVINPGEVGVQHAFGSVTAQPLLAGIHVVPPWASVERYSSREEQWPQAGSQVEEIEALSSEQMGMHIGSATKTRSAAPCSMRSARACATAWCSTRSTTFPSAH